MSEDASRWSNRTLLRRIRNPSERPYRITMQSDEVTFLGVPHQPDFAMVHIEMVPAEHLVELKSFKMYFGDFRNRTLSYERFLNVVFDDLAAIYAPASLRVTVTCRLRGGIQSTLVADSTERI